MRNNWPAESPPRASKWIGLAGLVLAQLALAGIPRPTLIPPDSSPAESETAPAPTASDSAPLTETPQATPTGTPGDPTPSSPPDESPAPTPLDPSPSPDPGFTPTPSDPATPSLDPTPTTSPTLTPAPLPPSPVPSQAVLINEIAWAGTAASANDEWIELHNPGAVAIALAGWRLTDGGDLKVALVGSIPGFGYFLLERTNDTTVSDLSADQIYTGSLRNTGERLELLGPQGEVVDTANSAGGGWPAGDADSRASMERRGGSDLPGNWVTFTGFFGNGQDAAGHPIPGTPRRLNSVSYPTPTPTGIPSRVVINEVLIRPRHDWEGTGGVTSADEFIELYNPGQIDVHLKGWWLDDLPGAGSAPFDLPAVTLPAKGYLVLFRTQTRIALNDTGDTVRLLAPDQHPIDEVRYLAIRAANLSYGRLPDGSDQLRYGLWPTPGQANRMFVEPPATLPAGPFFPLVCSGEVWPAGSRAFHSSMERIASLDTPASWMSFGGPPGEALDAKGSPIWGSPGLGRASGLTGMEGGRGSVLISEIAWAGTLASSSDEWIELHNPGLSPASLDGWLLTDRNDLSLWLSGSLEPGGYFLLERTDDTTVANLPADLVYTGSLRDEGEILWLLDPDGRIVDSANRTRPGRPTSPLDRALRHPAQIAWLWELGLLGCASPR